MPKFKITLLCLLFGFLFSGVTPATDASPEQDKALALIHALGCKGCHSIKGDGGSLASDLTQIGSRMTTTQIYEFLIAETDSRTQGFMPSYRSLDKADLELISHYLYNLR
ncbi:MAG: c-type cytochrome [Desulfuromonadales bacterium]|nr:c-type cytochrome [Desulfuromonadales bacterium]MBN2790937.1 c-type cytochrome [Desulfuromonadales bacterium]